MKTISIPTNNRPDLLARCLESVLAADGFDNWTLVFSCEADVDVRAVLNKSPMSWHVHFNPVRYGCRLNTFLAAAFANAVGSDFNLYLEDDCVISRDALTLCDQFALSGKPGVLCLRRWHETQSQDAKLVQLAPHGLLGNGFAYRREMFPLLQKYWFHDHPDATGFMWDWSVDWGMAQERVPQWRPMINRSRNIGLNGTHTQGGGNDLNHFGPCYGGEPVKEFRFA